MSTSQHAILSASGAERWLRCTPSARLEQTLPEEHSDYAEEGKLAHSIAELKLRKQYFGMKTQEFNKALKELQQNPLYQPEMLQHTDVYVEYIANTVYPLKSLPYIAIETRLDLSDYVPEGFGTGDCVLIYGNILHIIDFKYGKGVAVSAENNPQMRLYALGALKAYSLLYDIRHVKTTIVQPRLDSISEEEISVSELLTWGQSIKRRAEKAFLGVGEFKPGEHCRFCRARVLCRARAERYTALQDFDFKKPPLLSPEEVGDILIRGELIENWLTDLKEWALQECLNGNAIPGWKAVEGRSNRQFTNIDEAFAVLKKAGYDEALLYKREPLTLTEIEKLLSKPKFTELLSDYVVKPPGKPTLVKESDKREALTRVSAEDDFK